MRDTGSRTVTRVDGVASYCQRDGFAASRTIALVIVAKIAGFARSTDDHIIGRTVTSKGVASVVYDTLVVRSRAKAFIAQALAVSANIVERASIAIVTCPSFVDRSTHKDVT